MRLFSFSLLLTFTLIGCGRGQTALQDSVPQDGPASTSDRSSQYPQVEWSEPATANVLDASRAAWPANGRTVRRHFVESDWKSARSPDFRVWLNEHAFFQITIEPDSGKMTGIVKTTKTINSGPMSGERIGQTRATEFISNEDEALSLLEAYVKQDGTFDTLVRWSTPDNGNSKADTNVVSP